MASFSTLCRTAAGRSATAAPPCRRKSQRSLRKCAWPQRSLYFPRRTMKLPPSMDVMKTRFDDGPSAARLPEAARAVAWRRHSSASCFTSREQAFREAPFDRSQRFSSVECSASPGRR